MIFVWDEPKREANLDKHGLDFARLVAEFDFETALRLPAKVSRTGRSRLALIGRFRRGLIVVVIGSPLGTEAMSLVSLRRASMKERKLYALHR